MASLMIASGDHAGQLYELGNRPLSIGRKPQRDIQLLDPKVSRKHALLRVSGEGYLIAPAKALNGVEINRSLITVGTVLKDGDEVRLGDTILRFSETCATDRTNALHARKISDREARDDMTVLKI